jgi:hypothetical protein
LNRWRSLSRSATGKQDAKEPVKYSDFHMEIRAEKTV